MRFWSNRLYKLWFIAVSTFLMLAFSINNSAAVEKAFTVTDLPTHNDSNFFPPKFSSSSDGKIALAAYGSSGVYKSTNSGANWSPINVINSELDLDHQSVSDVWISSDGINQLVLVYEQSPNSPEENLWISQDSGITWTSRNPYFVDNNNNWVSIFASEDLSHIYLASDRHWSGSSWISGGAIYTSNDIGETFTIQQDGGSPSSGLYSWISISGNLSGQIIHAVASDLNKLFTSTDYGATWTVGTFTFGSPALGMQSSQDGIRILVSTDGAGFYLSTDSGSNFSQIDSTNISYNEVEFIGEKPNGVTWGTPGTETRWGYGLGVSRDGSKLAALSLGDFVFLSDDGGVTWQKQSTLNIDTWSGRAAITNNGSVIFGSSSNYGWWTPYASGVSYFVRTEYPDAPTIGSAAALSSTTASVSFTAPTDDGGKQITAYEITARNSDLSTVLKTQIFSSSLPLLGATTTFTVNGLIPGTTYRFSVAATNSVGNSYQSYATPAVTTFAASNINSSANSNTEELRRQQEAAAAKQKQDQELREILSLVPSIAGLSQSIAGLGNSLLLPQKCVKGKKVMTVKAGAKCPKGYKVKK